ncbi:MAG TPA: HAMP domain-containing sensor histidine kinase [Candidatus Limnocylindrales bacterium]|nr:HAMP domain-containing sensor histidine kinase [Candidatus Limnocylindrales bacterium]
MPDSLPPRLAVQPPSVTPPPRFVERRVAYRRAADQLLHEERSFVARCLDCLAADSPAEDRLASVLKLLARTSGARRVAVLADGIERRSAVSVAPGEDPSAAEALATWLDATARRSRADRAAAAPAPVSLVEDVTARAPRGGASAATAAYALLPIPGGAVLGFEFNGPARAAQLDERLPAHLVRHAGAALAVITRELAVETEAATLRARDAEQTRFVSTVAHELGTPLTGLRGYLELILAGAVGDPAVEREFLGRSKAIVTSMSELVGDLLELSRLESGTLQLEIEPFSVAEAVGSVAAALLPIAIDRDIRLSTAVPPRLRSATADRRRVEQIVTNLAGNALKFTAEGGTVDLVARLEGPIAVIVVRDDGAGIGLTDRERIFERFARLDAHDAIAGTGLGLPIARDLARRMGGDLGVASVPGSGSAFALVLPGPTAVPREAIAMTLAITLAGEEHELEERAVLRALAAGSNGAQENGAGTSGAAPRGASRRDRFQTPAKAVSVDR